MITYSGEGAQQDVQAQGSSAGAPKTQSLGGEAEVYVGSSELPVGHWGRDAGLHSLVLLDPV